MFFELPATVEKTHNWFNNNIGNESRSDFSFRNREGALVAFGGFTSIDKIHRNAEFYIMVNPEMHGKGIGSKVSRWLFNYAFEKLGLNKIYLYTNNTNERAYQLYEKCSFRLEGLLIKHKFKNGKFEDRRLYGLLREEWFNLEWKNLHITENVF
jgi:diamine N-acetyltransferase